MRKPLSLRLLPIDPPGEAEDCPLTLDRIVPPSPNGQLGKRPPAF